MRVRRLMRAQVGWFKYTSWRAALRLSGSGCLSWMSAADKNKDLTSVLTDMFMK